MTQSIAIRSSPSRPRPRPAGTERHRDAAVATASDLKHIFLIAGPSGSGKSTFMREFVFDRLPKDVSDALPDDAKLWQRTSGNELSRKGLERIRAEPRTHAGPRRPLRHHASLFQALRAVLQRPRDQGADRVRRGADRAHYRAEPRGAARAVPEARRRPRLCRVVGPAALDARAEAQPARGLLQADRQETEAVSRRSSSACSASMLPRTG